jgi:hypothetical protein
MESIKNLLTNAELLKVIDANSLAETKRGPGLQRVCAFCAQSALNTRRAAAKCTGRTCCERRWLA